MGQSKGNTKSSKRDQPKRKRYVQSGRGQARRLEQLKQHCRKWANDKQARQALNRLESNYGRTL